MLSYDETFARITGIDCDYEKTIKSSCRAVLSRIGLLGNFEEMSHNVMTEIVMELLEKRSNGFWSAIQKAKDSPNPESSIRKIVAVAARYRVRRTPKKLGKEFNVNSDDKNIESFCEHHDNPLHDLIVEERDQIVQKAVSQLKTLQRDCLVYFYFKKMSLAEIAASMEIPEGTVKRRIHDAKEKLKGILNDLTI
jgi:RNA polymerase sigma-70 factor (ECF subfamily)